MTREGLQLQSTVREDGVLQIALATVTTPDPGPGEVVVRMEAAPLNPSDMGLLFAGADMSVAEASGSADSPVITAKLSPAVIKAMAGRRGEAMPVGNEGAGVVVDAGSSPEAQALLGKTVGVTGGGMYAQFRLLPASACLLLPEGTSPREGAACFVNPLTTLGMIGTMQLEGHTALIHTAAASNLGQMLNKLCIADGVGLVNVVRRPEQAQLLRDQGARFVCDSSQASFMDDLTDAIEATGATLAFDATGGGRLASNLLAAMEAAAVRKMAVYNRYGSTTFKQVYIYGGLDRSPTELIRTYGMAWSLGGWLLTPYLGKIGPQAAQALRERVAREVKTTFASNYTKEISLREALSLSEIAGYGKMATGEKYLINPAK